MTIIKKLISPLISSFELRSLMKDKDMFLNSYRIVEANVGQIAKADYDRTHIAHATYMDTMHGVQPSKLYPRGLPNKDTFQDYIGSMGISNDHNVIVYDRSPYGFYAAARIWWLFKYFGHDNITILNGGFNNWINRISVLSAHKPVHKPHKFEIRENKNLITNYDQIIENIKTQSSIVVDARPQSSFHLTNEGDSLVQTGHIPGSKNVPYLGLFDSSTGVFKDIEQLSHLFQNISSDKEKPLIASCLSGMAACSVLFAANLLGFRNLSLYNGSWTEYSQKTPNQGQNENNRKATMSQ